MKHVDDDVARAVLDASPDGIAISDAAGRIVLVNQRLLELFGYARGELDGQPVELLVPHEVRSIHIAHRHGYHADPSTRPMGAELKLFGERRDGSRFPVEISLSPVRTRAGDLVISIVRDVTNRLELQDQVLRAELRTSLAEDRERIARDLHDTVIQRLFADGLSIQSVLPKVDEAVRARLQAVLDDHDDAIREIRTTILGLSRSTVAGGGLRQAILEVVEQASRVLGFRPALRLDGVLEDRFDDVVRADLLATLRESLSNAARHARPSAVDVELTAGHDLLELTVTDNGIGLDPERRSSTGSGLNNITARAEHHRGACRIEPRPGGGTIVRWAIPVA